MNAKNRVSLKDTLRLSQKSCFFLTRFGTTYVSEIRSLNLTIIFFLLIELCEAATKIQASFRGHMSRKEQAAAAIAKSAENAVEDVVSKMEEKVSLLFYRNNYIYR